MTSDKELGEVNTTGNFQCHILEYGLREADSGAVGVYIKVRLTTWWENGEWNNWEEGAYAIGVLWVIKKDKTTNTPQVEALCKYAGWNGDLESVASQAWKPTPCQVVVNSDEYMGKIKYRISYVNALDSTPGGNIGSLSSDRAKELQAQHGSSLRAIAGNARRNTAPSNGGPAAPSRGPSGSQTRQANEEARARGEDIPF